MRGLEPYRLAAPIIASREELRRGPAETLRGRAVGPDPLNQAIEAAAMSLNLRRTASRRHSDQAVS
jgi:hypothetical protein